MAEGKQIRLFLIDGTFSGLVTAEIMNWTGHVFKGSRSELARIYQREEAQRTGVYILLGDKSDGSPLAYIGETDNIASRLKQHASKKAFWNEVVFVTSKDGNLTSAHARYIEAQLIQSAKEIGRIPLENGNEPTGGADLPEADASDMDHFIREFLTILPVLGVEIFRGRSAKWDADPSEERVVKCDSPVFQIVVKRHGGTAYGQIVDGEFTVLKGSAIAAEVTHKDNVAESTRKQFELRKQLHARLRGEGVIVVSDGGTTTLTKDVPFSSPSAAAAFVQGRATANGRREWKTKDDIAYADWESGNNPFDSCSF